MTVGQYDGGIGHVYMVFGPSRKVLNTLDMALRLNRPLLSDHRQEHCKHVGRDHVPRKMGISQPREVNRMIREFRVITNSSSPE